MTIPSTISDALTSLQAQVVAAAPVSQASHATVLALQLNAGDLIESIQTELTAPSLLDTWTPPADPQGIVAGFLTVESAADDASTLALMRGVVGRVAANLEQVG